MSSSVSDYSPQAVFDATARHLASMPGPSISKANEDSYSCLYRGPGGSRCAVGFWIPDDKYSRSMEKVTVLDGLRSAQVQAALPEPLQKMPMLRLLNMLQEAHDSEMNWNRDTRKWRRENLSYALRAIAAKRKLRVSVIKECFE